MVGLGLLLAGTLFAFVGRALSRAVLAAGLLVTAALALREWQSGQDLLVVGGTVLAGAAASALVSGVLRFVSVLVEIAAFAGGWYLLVYATYGPAFLATNVGLATWGVAAVLSALVVDLLSRRRKAIRAVPLAVAAAHVF